MSDNDRDRRTSGSPLPEKVPVEVLRRQCNDLGLQCLVLVQSALQCLELDPLDKQAFEFLTDQIAEAKHMQLISPDPFRATNPISPADLPGSIGLGFIPPSGVPWLITPEILLTHVLIVARSGGGKSNLIFLILAQLLVGRRYD